MLILMRRSRPVPRGGSTARPTGLALPLAVLVTVAGLALAGAGSGVALAASPDASASASAPAPSLDPSAGPDGELGMAAWLDAPLPAAAPAGSILQVGALVFRDDQEPLVGVTLQLRLHPASGSAEPTFDYGHQDFAGHVVAELEVPEGGVGALDIVLPGTMCENDVCGPVETMIPVRGVGPPPDVPLSTLATTLTTPPIEALVAGRASSFQITVQPRIEWPEPGLDLPSAIWLQVRVSRGPVIQDVAANLDDPLTGRYVVPITFPEPGEYVLEAGTRPEADGTDLLPGSLIRVTVEALTSPVPGPEGTNEEMPGWLVPALIILALAGLLVASGVTRRR